jgi:FtsH-binding integral membrane protein
VFAPNSRLGCKQVEDPENPGEMTCEKDNMRLLYAGLGVVLFALIMLFDTSMVIGGNSFMFVLGPECYILGAIQLYLEIINMFVLILVILGESG